MNALQLLRHQHSRARRLVAEARRGDAGPRDRLIAFLRAHASVEEEHIFAKLEDDEEVAAAVEDGYREHELLADVLTDLERLGPGDPQTAGLLDELDELLDGQTAIEEGALFPYIEREWPRSLLDEVGARIAARLFS